MNDVGELKRYIIAHARAQSIPPERLRELLGRIRNDDGDAPGSWVRAWVAEGDLLYGQGRLYDACRYYMLARFPYPDGAAREEAQRRCVEVFDRFRRDDTAIQRLDVAVGDGLVRCYATGLSRERRPPLLILMGGIVSIKEQWAYTLRNLERAGLAAVVAELPGIGENTLPYTPDGRRMLTAIMDAVGDRVDAARTYAIMPSFAGHLALRCAVDDRRIRGVVSAGAPINRFFTDGAWQRGLPRVTVDTLAHLMGTAPDRLPGELPAWALTAEQLTGLTIPVHYMAARRDEIIPRDDLRFLKDHVRRLHLVENDDVHGSPAHHVDARIWTARSIMRMRGAYTPQRAALSAAWFGRRAWRRLAGRTGAPDLPLRDAGTPPLRTPES
ncbi:alpha/beta hydrolase [Actinomadura sp. 6K520]|uniref:alpha/beta hydrolase n=1 Tax=Actinomadura sp. 6K520 TaxID=2530364 RepID=UPI001048EA98|nr:alpha/beta hydrolase [Actinomadura sp. 6K520]TDE24973.1 alpha/beta hydrolase [Actinomadura sp. 6K520]